MNAIRGADVSRFEEWFQAIGGYRNDMPGPSPQYYMGNEPIGYVVGGTAWVNTKYWTMFLEGGID